MPDRYRPARGETVTSLSGVSNDSLLTLHECAHILRCTYGTVREAANRGEIVSIRVSPKNIRVRASDLRAYIDSHVRGRHREPLFPPLRAHRASTT